MTAMDILDAMGFIEDRFLQEARETPKVRKLPLRRALLMAAAAAVLAALLGCAVLLYSLRDLELGTVTYDAGAGQTEQARQISLQGYMESPAYRAAREWLEFCEGYDPDGSLLAQADAQGYLPPRDYDAYLCFTPEMAAKADEIASRYGLSLLGQLYTAGDPAPMLVQLGLPSLKEGYTLQSACCYAGGTCQLTFSFPWEGQQVFGNLRYVRKGDFDTVVLALKDPASFTQWTLSLDGQEILLALGEDRGLVILDGNRFFTTLVIYKDVGREALENLARSLPLAAEPQKPEFPQILTTDYRGYIQARSKEVSHPENLVYAQLDLDGDGIEEFFDGFAGADIYELVTMNGGQPQPLLTGGGLYLCQGNVVEQEQVFGRIIQSSYYEIRDAGAHLITAIRWTEGDDPEGPWMLKKPGSEEWVPIPEEKLQEILAQFPRVPLETTPIDQHPG